MTEQNQTKQEKPSFEDLEQVLALLTTDQIRFVVARQQFSTDKEAAEEIGIKPDTVYQWKHKGHPIDDAVKFMAFDGVITALHIRKRHLAEAMAVKVAGLKSDDERLRQNVATEVIEWELGRATQPQEHDIKRGGTLHEALDVALKRAYDDDGGG